MASKKEENVLHENLGRCTRSGRRLTAMPTIAASPSRTTRRSAKKLQEQLLVEAATTNMGNVSEMSNVSLGRHHQETTTTTMVEQQNVIEEIPTEVVDGHGGGEQQESTTGAMVVIEDQVPLPSQLSVDDIIVEEAEEVEEVDDKDELSYADAIIEECHPYDEEVAEEEEEEQMFETIRVEEENPAMTVIGSDAGCLDLEKSSSSFPFDTTVGGGGGGANSETSEEDVTDDQQQHPLQEEQHHHQELLDGSGHLSQNVHLHHRHHHHHHPHHDHDHGNNSSMEDNNGSVEISLLASLAGDNANSLPSVGGGESEGLSSSEDIYKKDDYESKVMLVENCEKMDSESSDSMSEPAIAEDLAGEDGALNLSDATIINTELVSEDELPPMMTLVKPQINDAEEVSDEELPAPKRAELPPDAELISDDDELLGKGATMVATRRNSQQQSSGDTPLILGKKRKCDDLMVKDNSSNVSINNVVDDDGQEMDEVEGVEEEDELEEDKHNPNTNTTSTTTLLHEQCHEKEKSHSSKDKNEQYNPMSPTSESNDSNLSAPAEKKAKFDDSVNKAIPDEKKDIIAKRGGDVQEATSQQLFANSKESNVKELLEKNKEEKKERKHLPELDKFWKAVINDPTDFTGWTYLLQYVDNETDAEAAREAYDAFLSHYPYCYGYWRKYADYEKRKGLKVNCNTVFERGLEAIPLSVDLWIHYLTHVKSNPQHKPAQEQEEFVRSQFERAVEACGLEFRSDKLWDAYIKWEHESKSYQRIVKIYDRLLTIPTQGYKGHFDNLHDLINQHPIEECISLEEIGQLRAELREEKGELEAASSRRSKSHRMSVDDHQKEKDHLVETTNESASGGVDPSPPTTTTAQGEGGGSMSLDQVSSNQVINVNSAFVCNENRVKKSVGLALPPPPPPPPPPTTLTPTPTPSTPIIPSQDEEKIITENHPERSTNTTTTMEEEMNDDGLVVLLKTLTESECQEIREQFMAKRRKVHKNTATAVSARWSFEEGIKRPYFHVKPLERCQLKNWKDYLDFEIENGDRKRILVLFERCLIACALYEEFWLKMLRYLETQMTTTPPLHNNINQLIRNTYRRACEIHHPDKPSLHLMWVAFEECQNNFDRAADILTRLEVRVPNLLQIAYRRINVERRRGDHGKCRQLYEHYIETAKNKNIAGSLAIKYARFLNKICHDLDGGLMVLRQALEKDPANTRVALQMIDLALQRSQVDEDEVVAIMDKFMARENIDPEQRVLFAQRKVEFLEDFGSTAKGLLDAQRALQMALTKANEAKKKCDSSPIRKNVKDATSSMYNNMNSNVNVNSGTGSAGQTTANYTYNSNNSTVAYYGQQQQQQQQQGHHHHPPSSGSSYPSQQQSYDNYYNHWQYGSSGYSGYGQWSGYGNYY